MAKLEAQSEQTSDMVKEIHQHVVGTPSTQGLVTRVSTLETKQRTTSRVIWTSVTVFFGAISAVFVSFFKG